MEAITESASNSLFVFLFCNMIIVILIVTTTFKPNSSTVNDHDSDSDSSLQVIIANNKTKNILQENIFVETFVRGSDQASIIVVEEVSNSKKIVIEEDTNKDHDVDVNGDELRKRVEEFIEKVNRGWRDENLRTNFTGRMENSRPQVTRICAF